MSLAPGAPADRLLQILIEGNKPLCAFTSSDTEKGGIVRTLFLIMLSAINCRRFASDWLLATGAGFGARPSKSFSIMRPSGPVPFTVAMSIPSRLACRLARGDDRKVSLDGEKVSLEDGKVSLDAGKGSLGSSFFERPVYLSRIPFQNRRGLSAIAGQNRRGPLPLVVKKAGLPSPQALWPTASSSANGVPTGTVWPTSTRISRKTASTFDSISMSTLSVEMERRRFVFPDRISWLLKPGAPPWLSVMVRPSWGHGDCNRHRVLPIMLSIS